MSGGPRGLQNRCRPVMRVEVSSIPTLSAHAKQLPINGPSSKIGPKRPNCQQNCQQIFAPNNAWIKSPSAQSCRFTTA